MKKLEIIIKPEKLESLKNILDDCEASGLMITNIMGYGNQKGFRHSDTIMHLLAYCFFQLLSDVLACRKVY